MQALLGCEERNPGTDPLTDQLFFPQGLLLDPRTPLDAPARYLIVSSGNNNRAYNSGIILAIDLDRFFAAWAVDPDRDLSIYPYCEVDPDDPEGETVGRCVRDVGASIDALHPCRRLPLQPRVVECDEAPFIVGAGARIGTFSTQMAAARRGPTPQLWIPVRGEPSITFIDMLGSPDTPPEFECEQPEDDERCAENHRLSHLRNDRGLEALQREPFTIIIDESDTFRYAYIAHSAGARLSIIDLDGLQIPGEEPGVRDGRPAIVSSPALFTPVGGTSFSGGYGIARRPCDPARSPTLTLGCERPLVYGSFRYSLSITSFTVGGLDLSDAGGSVRCGAPNELGEPGVVDCEATIQSFRQVAIGGLDLTNPVSTALGDVAFADAAGEDLLVLQTNPGALMRVNTSLDERSAPYDTPSGPPLELCDEPNRMRVWPEEGLAFISCFDSANVYAVDVRAMRLVDVIVTGTGPNELALDPIRKMLYVAHTLEASIGVIDVDRTRPTYLKEVGRIGLQEPFSQ